MKNIKKDNILVDKGSLLVETYVTKEGYNTAIVLKAPGYYCGYIGVTRSNDLYGKKIKYIDSNTNLTIYKGVTYADKDISYPVPGVLLWWIGFDTIHAGDKINYDIVLKNSFFSDNTKKAIKEMKNIMETVEIKTNSTFKDINFIRNELNNLSKQLKQYEK
jgi:hypothetical protein